VKGCVHNYKVKYILILISDFTMEIGVLKYRNGEKPRLDEAYKRALQ